jgi:hypothetical protein
MYTASKRHVLVAQWLAWGWIRTIGPRLLPGPREQIELGSLPEITTELGWPDGALRGVAVYRRRDTVRTGLTAVAVGTGRSALIKIRSEGEGLAREQRMLATTHALRTRSFRTPEPLGSGMLPDGSSWSAQQMVFAAPHRPCTALPPGLLEELPEIIGAAAELPSVDDPGWTPAHGDLTPWNLRRAADGRLWLFDWEDACLAPAGADGAYFAAALGVIRPRRAMIPVSPEVATFWSDRIRARMSSGHPTGPNEIMLDRLQRGLDS